MLVVLEVPLKSNMKYVAVIVLDEINAAARKEHHTKF